MKKNFFKKLSFVMALAMVLLTLAPAASAFAATSPSLNVDKKYLYLNEEGKINEYDFNIKNRVTGSKYAWASDNAAVAEVDATNGVTVAKAVGTAKITVTITLPTGKTKVLTATVVVRDNIETIDVSNVPTTDLSVNKEYDFNRSYTTFNGSQVKTSSISRWSVSGTGATIEATSGKFVATAAGEYEVTVSAFQSSALYAAGTALTSKTIKVVVAPSVVATKQVNATKFTVEFDADMSKSDFATKAVVAQVVNGKAVTGGAEKIKKVSYDTTGKIATVEMYTAFTAKSVYTVTFGKLVGTFTAASTDLADVTDIVVADFTTNVTTGAGQNILDKVTGVNKDGVVILTGAQLTALGANFTYTYKGDLTKGYVGGNMAYIYSEGYTAPIEVKYTAYVYNSTTKAYDTVTFTKTVNATGVKPNTALNTGSMQYALSNATVAANATTVTWGSSVTMAAKETAVVTTRFKNNNPATDDGLDSTYTATPGRFAYTSSNTDLLLITGTSMYAIAPGTVTVLVKDTTANNAVVGTFDVVIQAARTFAGVTTDTASVTVGNNGTTGETAYVKITAKDSMGSNFVPTVSAPSFASSPVSSNTALVVFGAPVTNSDNSVSVPISARTAKAGYYNVKLTIGGFGTSTKDVYVTVIVVEANTADTTAVVSWKVELGKTAVDLKNVDAAIASSIDVYGYNNAGVRVSKLPAADYTVTVKKGDTTVSTNNTSFDIATVSAGAVSGPAVLAVEATTYIVTATVSTASGAATTGRVNGSYIGAASIVVSDTTTKSVAVDTLVVTKGTTIEAAAKEAFTFYYNGTSAETMTAAGADTMTLTKVTYSKGATALTSVAGSTIGDGESVYISTVEFTKHDDSTGNNVVYSFAVDKTVVGK